MSGSSHFRYLRHFFAGDARSRIIMQYLGNKTKLPKKPTVKHTNGNTQINYRHHHHHPRHQARPHPVDDPPHHHLRAWPPLHLLLVNGKEPLPDGDKMLHDYDENVTLFSPQLGRVGSDREREENKIFTVRGQMEPPDESAV